MLQLLKSSTIVPEQFLFVKIRIKEYNLMAEKFRPNYNFQIHLLAVVLQCKVENSNFSFLGVTVSIVHFWWLRLSYNLLWSRIALSYHTINTSFRTASYKKFFWSFCSYKCANPHPIITLEKKIVTTGNQESHPQGQILHFQEHGSRPI